MIADIETENGSCDNENVHFRGALSHRVEFDTFYLCAKSDDSSSSHSRDIIGDTQNLKRIT